MKKTIIFIILCLSLHSIVYSQNENRYVKDPVISIPIYEDCDIHGYGSITLKPGFSIKAGANVNISIVNNASRVIIPYNKTADVTYSTTKPVKYPEDLALTDDNAIVSVNYYDGFGNVEQSQVLNSSPDGRDLISFSEFKPGATTQKSFLGFAANTQGAFMDNPEAALKAFYSNPNDNIADDSRPWAESAVEDSPLNRVINSTNVGEGMDAHKQLSDYNFNVAGQVPMWSLVGDVWKFVGYYPANTHFVQLVTDENGKQATIITNSMGQKVVSKSGNVENWYVYDDLGRLVHTIPSAAIDVIKKSVGYELKLDKPIVKEFVYTYKYVDNVPNVVEKYLPGVKGSVEYVYDKLNRVVLSRNITLKKDNKWSFIKYDKFGRVIQTGVFTAKANVTRSTLQYKLLTDDILLFEDRITVALSQTDPVLNAISNTYTSKAFPSTSFTTEVAAVQVDVYNFYDKYIIPGMEYSVLDDPLGKTLDRHADNITNTLDVNKGFPMPITNPIGQLTSKAMRINGGVTDGKYRTSAFYYNNKGALISTVSSSIFDDKQMNRTYIKYDFTGKAEKSLSLYNRKLANGGFALMEISQYHTYDRMGRLLTVDQQIAGDANGRITMAKYEYNALGQLKAKNLHKKANGTFLQTVDYAYNIRGQITDINNVNDKNSDDVFAMHINYNKQLQNGDANAKLLWNGFISSVEWRNHDQAEKRAYSFEYDDNYRLTAAKYSEGDNRDKNVGKYNMSAVYDNMGNITNLTRNGGDNGLLIDDITYTYKDAAGNATNKLSSVTDKSDVSLNGQYGFGKPNAQFVYDDLGNLIEDSSRDVLSIVYNYRNLPIWVLLTNNVEVTYTYDAEGTKLTRKIKQGNGATQQTNYEGSFVYQTDANNKLALSYFAHTQGGRVTITNNIYKYEYFLADHLGNVRATFGADQNGNLAVLQTTDYYPFGLTMAGSKAYSGQDYQYGGKEWQNATNVYDFHARQYNPALGRWFNPDPMMEKYTSVSPYNYCLNNPISYIDPNGMDVTETADGYTFTGSDLEDLWNKLNKGWKVSSILAFSERMFGGSGGGGGGGGGGGSYHNTVSTGGSIIRTYYDRNGNYITSETFSTTTPDAYNIEYGGWHNVSFNSFNQNASTSEGVDGFGITSDVIGGTGVLNGLVGFDAAINSTHTLRYAQRINGVKISAAELTAISQNKALKLFNSSKSFGKKLGIASSAVIVADVMINSEIKVSHGINSIMTILSFTPLAPIAGVWFVADFGYGLITGKSISDNIDSVTPSYDWEW